MVNVVTTAADKWICWLELIDLVQRSAATWRCATFIRRMEWTFAMTLIYLTVTFSNLEQVANLLCAHANSVSYPSWDGKWVVAFGLRGEGLVWLIGTVVCLLAANRGSNCSLTQAVDGCMVCCGIISSCQSATTSEIVKALLATSSSHVRGAIPSTGLCLLLSLIICW